MNTNSFEGIRILTSAEAVRCRPQMYFNVDDPDVAATLAMQALCHAVDDAIDDRCTRIRMRIDGAEIEVRYDSGMPLDHDAEHPERSVAQAFLTIHAACHSRKRHLEVGSDLCQIGLAVLNAVCSKLTADIRQGGKQVLMTFERGELMEGEGPAVSSTEEPDETRLRFALDRQVLPKNQPAEDALRRALGDVRSRLPTLKIEMEYAHRD